MYWLNAVAFFVVLVLEAVFVGIESCFKCVFRESNICFILAVVFSFYSGWYMMLDVWQCLFNGHVSFTWQSQSFTVFSVLLPNTVHYFFFCALQQ